MAHNADIHYVDGIPNDVNSILTGSPDKIIRMYNHRKLTSKGSPAKAFVFKSATEDTILNIWDVGKIGELELVGTLQTWRMIDLQYRSKKVLAKPEKLKVHIPECSSF
ncbi:hypothetical protein BUALT_Bualt10G0069100 [Buddleja alternifolia]|uniref:Uncharacterized protein n=1 Tax=Buddleja alternifolia TaxID=168488 RepID=A0AAV6X5B7_9LAMI|nr:hypothetical protein BUALT_Bualt10G0069100 [Buddleja alternifolia]